MTQQAVPAIAVIGAGAWGTALANAAAVAGCRVTLWARDAAQIAAMRQDRSNQARLPDVPLHERVTPEALLQAAVSGVQAVLLVVPAQTVAQMAATLQPVLPQGVPVIICAKGIDRASGHFMSEVVEEAMPGVPVMVLSGPSFAQDVGLGLPTAVVLAGRDEAACKALAETLSSPRFRVYHSTDLRGVEIGGAAKNVLAIAAGIVAGRGLGESARAALTARGFAELLRFSHAFGGRPETLMGLSGLGDLVLTCASDKSRNFAFGLALGRGASVEQASGGKLAEGALTAGVLVVMARSKGVDMPIAEAVNAVLEGRSGIDEAVAGLMARPLKAEH
jgi:glycerol-3-phosphate dehydrogenase (NAD(P)+)